MKMIPLENYVCLWRVRFSALFIFLFNWNQAHIVNFCYCNICFLGNFFWLRTSVFRETCKGHGKVQFFTFHFNSVRQLEISPKQLKYSFPSPPQVRCPVPLFWLLSVSTGNRWLSSQLPCSCHLRGQWGSTVALQTKSRSDLCLIHLAYKTSVVLRTSSVLFPLCRDFGGHMKILEHKVERVRITTSTLNEMNREIIL